MEEKKIMHRQLFKEILNNKNIYESKCIFSKQNYDSFQLLVDL